MHEKRQVFKALPKIYKESTVFDENAFFYYRHRKRPDSSFLKIGIALLHDNSKIKKQKKQNEFVNNLILKNKIKNKIKKIEFFRVKLKKIHI